MIWLWAGEATHFPPGVWRRDAKHTVTANFTNHILVVLVLVVVVCGIAARSVTRLQLVIRMNMTWVPHRVTCDYGSKVFQSTNNTSAFNNASYFIAYVHVVSYEVKTHQ